MSKKDDFIEKEGIIVEANSKVNFKVKIEDENNRIIDAHVSGNIKKSKIRIIVGDRVILQISPYDLNRGRIVYRMK